MRRYETIKQAAEEAFRAGKTNQETLAFVKAAFPHRRTTIESIHTLRFKARQADKSIPTQNEARRARLAVPVAETDQTEALATSYAGLVNDRLATKDDVASLRKDMEAIGHRLNARIAYAQVVTVMVLSAVMALLTFFNP